MSDQPRSEKQVSSPKYLSLPWLIALVAGLCVVPALAGAVAQEVGGWLGWVICFVAWGMMFVLSWIVTYKYANPIIPTLCGAMVGVTMPRPSDEWVRQFAGEKWLKASELGMTMVGAVIGLTIFYAIAKRHKSSSAG